MNKDWSTLLPQAEAIVKEAGRYLMSEWGKVEADKIEDKAVNSLVSYVDRSAESILVERLSALLPGATFLTEENTVENVDSSLQWVIDPLDGTTNYLHGIPFFVVSVGLLSEGRLELGLIFDPVREESFTAARGQGAHLNGRPISVSSTRRIQDALLATGFPYQGFGRTRAHLRLLDHYIRTARGIRRCGAAALDLAYTACGRFDGYFEYSLNPWDVAAGILLVQEAGGRLGDFRGGDDCLFGSEIVAANPFLFEELDSRIREGFSGTAPSS